MTDLIRQAQERGINLAEAEDGSWHGSLIHDGQEYSLDGDTIEQLAADMFALSDIFREDDAYSVEYSDDLDRYLVSVQGFETPFAHATLAKAFEDARRAYHDKLAQQEAERKQREDDERRRQEAAKPTPSKRMGKAGNGPAGFVPAGPPTSPPTGIAQPPAQPEALGGSDYQQQVIAELQGIRRAIENIAATITAAPRNLDLASPATEFPEEWEEAAAKAKPPAPPKKKRGLSKA